MYYINHKKLYWCRILHCGVVAAFWLNPVSVPSLTVLPYRPVPRTHWAESMYWAMSSSSNNRTWAQAGRGSAAAIPCLSFQALKENPVTQKFISINFPPFLASTLSFVIKLAWKSSKFQSCQWLLFEMKIVIKCYLSNRYQLLRAKDND